jgi:hypothetical protein
LLKIGHPELTTACGGSVLTGKILLAVNVTIPTSMLVTKLAVNALSSGTHVIMGLYNDAGNVPGTLVATTGSSTVSLGANEIPVTGGPVRVAGGSYWIVTIYDADTTMACDSTRTNMWWLNSLSTFPTSLPATWSGGSSISNWFNFALYVVLTQ